MKYLLLFMLIGCSYNNEIQQNIDHFTNNCEQLAKCMKKDYKIEIKLNNYHHPLTCKIKFSRITTVHVYPMKSDLTVVPTFGYDYLSSAVRVCKMMNKVGDYSDIEQNAQHRYGKCVELNLGDEAHRKACWRQYVEGEFHD